MKKIFYTLLLCLPAAVFAQVGVGTTTPDASAQLDISSTTKGVLFPRLTTTQRNAMTSPVTGLMIFNTTDSVLQVNTGTATAPVWTSASGGSLSNVTLINNTRPAGKTVGQMIFNTNAASGLPVGPVYWDGTKWVAVGSNTNATEVFTNGTPPVAPYLTGTTGVVYTDTLSNSPTLGNQYIWNGSSFVSYTSPNATAFYNQNTTNDAGSAKSTTIYRPGALGLGSNTKPDASAQLDVNSTSKGLLPPRMTQAQMNAIVSPADGLIVYCTDCNPRGVWNYDGSQPAWISLGSNNIPNAVFTPGTLSCTGALTGTYQQGIALTSSNTKAITVTAVSGGKYSASTNTVNGVSFSASTILFSAGAGTSIILTGSGTPLAAGTFTYTVTLSGQTCTFNITFAAAATFACGSTNYSGTPTSLVNAQTYSGGTISVPYTAGNGTPYTSTVVGPQSGLSLTRTAGTYAAGGGNIVYTLSGIYSGVTGALVNFTLPEGCSITLGCGGTFTVTHTAGSVAPVSKTVSYGTVWTNLAYGGSTYNCWITQNLGADHQATSATDASLASAGWYWQFNLQQGYVSDFTTRTPNTPWITSISQNSDWTAANDPCSLLLGGGWRIPTYSEYNNAIVNGGWSPSYVNEYNSVLKIHQAGFMSEANGGLAFVGTPGYQIYWSGTQVDNSNAQGLLSPAFTTGMASTPKARGGTIRCIR